MRCCWRVRASTWLSETSAGGPQGRGLGRATGFVRVIVARPPVLPTAAKDRTRMGSGTDRRIFAGRVPCMRYLALATDYDGTLAHDGAIDHATVNTLERLRATGRKLILVTRTNTR